MHAETPAGGGELVATSAPVAVSDAKLAAVLAATKAPATVAAYRADWDDFLCWCATHRAASLPATAETVARYLAELAAPDDDRAPLAVATITRRLAAIGEAHRLAGAPSPTGSDLVRLTMRGVRRRLGVATDRRKDGVTTGDIRAIVAGLDPTKMLDVRDRALLLVGYATALRRAELVALDVEDLAAHPDGLLVAVRRSKTDQEAAGRRIEVAYGTAAETCPVRAWRAWATAAAIDSGPAWRRLTRGGHVRPERLAAASVARIVKARVSAVGLDPDRFAGHSLRRGFATEASRGGASDRTIARTTGHTSTTSLTPYIADAETFTDPPSAYLDL